MILFRNSPCPLVIIVIFFFSCTVPSTENKKDFANDSSAIKAWDSLEKKPQTVQQDEPVKENWEYTTKSDKMDSKEEYYAECRSINELYFKFPYDGGSSFTLTIQHRRGSNDVTLSTTKGQFLTEIYNEKQIRVKFDDEKPIRINIGGTTDGRSDMIFLYPSKKIISKLKNAKNVTIEPEFYEGGYQAVDFEVAGLKWNH